MNSSFSSKGAPPCDNVVDLFGMTQHIHPHKKLQGKFSDWSFPESILDAEYSYFSFHYKHWKPGFSTDRLCGKLFNICMSQFSHLYKWK